VVPLDRATVAYRLPDRRPADALHVMRESTEESYAELSAPRMATAIGRGA
jgi:hypothetical protein